MPGSVCASTAVRILLALAPLWLVGILDRGLWTPDEPREADIAWRMSQQSDRTLPELAGTPFLEKPPLSYWMSAAGLDLFGSSAAAARSPNILYAGITALAIGALAFTMSGGAAAMVAALVSASLLIVFRVTVWLAPDAGLLAGCAVAILGAYLGYSAPPGRRKLLGYCLLHLGAALGFMAKSAPGWLVPALALGTLIVWERRWSELARWELYAGFALQALVIGPWIVAVMRTPGGMDALAALFWHNVVGRFTKITAPVALDYSTGHKNAPGKYFLELPVYVLPWTLLVLAALVRAWRKVRIPGPEGTPWRFAIAASLPFLLVLSLAATARDIYSAPGLLGLGVLVALWLPEAQASPTRFDRWALRATRWLVALIGCGFAVFAGVMAFATAQYADLLAMIAVLGLAFEATRRSRGAQRDGDLHSSFAWLYGLYVAAVCITGLAVFPAIDRWHDLASLAKRIKEDGQHCELALLNPDETTIAMLDHGLRTRFAILDAQAAAGASPERLVSDWLNTHGASACVLVLLPGHAPGELTRMMELVHPLKRPDDGVAGILEARGTASVLRRYDVPQGRRYALLGPPDAGSH
jgi:4-amino-4-deoxy-L-arabinose transferase-like glycosyltransferase